MGLPELDFILTIQSKHRPGNLARVLTAIGEEGANIGNIDTVAIGKILSIRKVTISFYDEAHLERVTARIKEVGADILKISDPVMRKHMNGKIHCGRRKDIRNVQELRYVYTPGVARVCKWIAEHPEDAKKYTTIGNTVGIFTNGTRVLGLGDIGPVASLPVMEGKAAIYDQFVGLSAVPILIDTKDPDEFIEAVIRVAPTFGAIHLEDIRVPDCFQIEDALCERLHVPVMHDDQHGTAVVVLAAILSIHRRPEFAHLTKPVIAQIGLGAAGFGIASLLLQWGADVVGVDPNPAASEMFKTRGGRTATLEAAVAEADILVCTTGRPGLFDDLTIRPNQIILALSNPIPEISPEEALARGAAFAADGRTVNNALAYPGIFKGALAAGLRRITPEMKIAAAQAISALADDKELVPDVFYETIHQDVANAVAKAGNPDYEG